MEIDPLLQNDTLNMCSNPHFREGMIIYTSDANTSADDQSGRDHHDKHESILETCNYLHIGTLLLIRIMVDFVFKNPLIFWHNYASGLGITDIQFAFILVSSELGCIAALFTGQFNERVFKSYVNIMVVYLMICGIASIMLIIAICFEISAITIIWCCIARFIVGLSFSFITSATIRTAADTVNTQNVRFVD